MFDTCTIGITILRIVQYNTFPRAADDNLLAKLKFPNNFIIIM
jgi:hypothetical protein